jgi:hypothetical protein
VLSALSRTLREDGKKSIDLTINIISVFFSFSHFSQFHPVRAHRAARGSWSQRSSRGGIRVRSGVGTSNLERG